VTIRFLLDTNVLSEPTRPLPDQRVVTRLLEHDGELATAAPAWHELLFGMERLPRSLKRRTLEDYLLRSIRDAIPILPYDQAAAEWHASQRARLAARGRIIPHLDGQIAAVAATRGLLLVTSNRSDFEPFEGLAIEDWKT
jgi:tRNA(fMet)-specific endonuclease VapC